MELISGKTEVTVKSQDGKEDLFSGIFMGFGLISRGIHSSESGIIVLAQSDSQKAMTSIHPLSAVEIHTKR